MIPPKTCKIVDILFHYSHVFCEPGLNKANVDQINNMAWFRVAYNNIVLVSPLRWDAAVTLFTHVPQGRARYREKIYSNLWGVDVLSIIEICRLVVFYGSES